MLGPTTVALFLMIVFAASALVSWFAPDLSDPNIAPLPLEPDYGLVWWQSPLGVASEVIRETVHAFAEVSTPRDVIEAQRMETLRDIEDTTAWGRFKRRIPLIPKEKKVKKRIVRRRDPRSPYSPTEDGPQAGFWARLIRKFMLGLSLVGILSFLKYVMTFTAIDFFSSQKLVFSSLLACLDLYKLRGLDGYGEVAEGKLASVTLALFSSCVGLLAIRF